MNLFGSGITILKVTGRKTKVRQVTANICSIKSRSGLKLSQKQKMKLSQKMSRITPYLLYNLKLRLIIGAVLGGLAAWLKRPTYTARLTFVVDDAKSGGSGGSLSALAGLAGFDLNGLGGASGVLAGDNVEELIKSRKLIKNTLVTAYDSTQTLADRYAAVNKLNNSWLKYSPDGKIIRFPLNGVHNNRIQDSLLHEMTELILSNEFGIAKPDKKLGFFEVNVTMKDERVWVLS